MKHAPAYWMLGIGVALLALGRVLSRPIHCGDLTCTEAHP